MTEEQMRARITELEKENKSLQDNFNTIQEQIKVKEETITSLNTTVSDLKQKNYDLFIQVSTPIETPATETPKENNMSVADIINNLI